MQGCTDGASAPVRILFDLPDPSHHDYLTNPYDPVTRNIFKAAGARVSIVAAPLVRLAVPLQLALLGLRVASA